MCRRVRSWITCCQKDEERLLPGLWHVLLNVPQQGGMAGSLPRLFHAAGLPNTQERSHRRTHPRGPAESGHCLALLGINAWIARVHGKNGEKKQSAPQRLQGWMVGHQGIQQYIEEVYLRYR